MPSKDFEHFGPQAGDEPLRVLTALPLGRMPFRINVHTLKKTSSSILEDYLNQMRHLDCFSRIIRCNIFSEDFPCISRVIKAASIDKAALRIPAFVKVGMADALLL